MRGLPLAWVYGLWFAACGGETPRLLAQEMPQLNPDKKTWIQADELPTFRIRARVLSVQGKAPDGQAFEFAVGGAVYAFQGTASPVRTTGTHTSRSRWGAKTAGTPARSSSPPSPG